MPGLLDALFFPAQVGQAANALGAGDAIGGLLSKLYGGPVPASGGGPQYDQMGNFTGINTQFGSPSTGAPAVNWSGNVSPILQSPSPMMPPAPQARLQQEPDASPIAVGDYMMPRIGPASLYEPKPKTADAAALPPNAQPTQGTLPPAEQGGNFTAAANNFAAAPGLISKLTGAYTGLTTGQRTDPAGIMQQNQAQMASAVYQALQQKGMQPAQAMAVARAAAIDPKLAETLLPDALGLKPPANMEAFIAGQAHDASRGMGKVSPQSAMQTYNDFIKNKEAAQAGGKEVGTQQAQAQLELPSAVAQAKEAMAVADRLLTHKGREDNIWWHGKMSNYLPDTSIPGNTDAIDAQKMLAQLQGGAFLNAYKSLRGGGQISNIEGAKAEQAILRASRAQSSGEFNQAINDFKSSLRLAIDNANFRAGNAPPNNFEGSQVQSGAYTWSPNGGLQRK